MLYNRLRDILTATFMQAVAALLLMLTSCTSDTPFSSFRSTSISGWDKSDVIDFEVPPLRKARTCSETVSLRTTALYPYMSLTLVVEQTIRPGSRHYIDTLSCHLTDEDGNIQGQGVSRFEYDFALRTVRLSEKDTLHVSIHHNMKREVLPGISDIGLTLRSLRQPQ